MLKITISKEELSSLPTETFPGKIYLINSVADASKAIAFLRKNKYIGFDTETRPAFKKGVLRKMALMQLSTHEECFLFRINKIGIPDCLKEFLEDKNVTKIGLSIKDDLGVLRRSNKKAEFEGFVEIQNMVKTYGISDISLQKIYGILFDKRISKNQRLSNWEAPSLSIAQQEYAALDAWACLKIYDFLNEGNFNRDKSKYLKDVESPITPTV